MPKLELNLTDLEKAALAKLLREGNWAYTPNRSMNRRQTQYVLGQVRELQKKKMPGECDGSTSVLETDRIGSTPIPGTEEISDATTDRTGDGSPAGADNLASEQSVSSQEQPVS